MASRFSIETIFSAIDKFTAPLSKMTRSSKTFTKTLKADYAKAQRQVESFAKNFKKNLGRNLLIGVGIATAAATKLIMDGAKAWDIQAAAIENVRAGLQSTANGAGRSLEQLERQASSLQANTFIGDESILQGVTSQLLTFTNITESRFDRAQSAIMDVSAKLNGVNVTSETLRSTSIQLGKALNDVANMSSLSRSGIQFTEVQKKEAKALYAAGKMAEYQNLVLTEIERQYGGTAAALSKTAGGMQLQVKNLTSDMLELVGKGIEPLRLKFLQFATVKFLPTLMPYIEKLTAFIENNADVIFKTFMDTLTFLFNVIKTGVKVFIFLFKILKPFAPIIFGIVGALIAYKIIMLAAAAAQMILNGVMAVNPVTLIVIAIGVLIGLIYLLVKNWDKVVAALKAAWDWIVKVTKAIIDGIVKAFKNLIDAIWNTEKGFTMFSSIISVVLGPIGILISMIMEVGRSWDVITEKFKSGDILGGILAIGGALLSGLLAPIQGFLELISKIPGLSKLAGGGAKKIEDLRMMLKGEKKEPVMAPISPTERALTSYRKEETTTTNKGEVTIVDKTGKAVVTKKPAAGLYTLNLQTSGGFIK